MNSHFGYATSLGGSKMYEPADGKIAVEYKNVSWQPVTIDVYRMVRICDAESCRFLDNTKEGHTLVFKINELKSITTSKDESYSVISGCCRERAPLPIRRSLVHRRQDVHESGKGLHHVDQAIC